MKSGAVLAILATTLFSCSKKSERSNQNTVTIVGKWHHDKTVITDYVGGNQVSSDTTLITAPYYITYNANKTGFDTSGGDFSYTFTDNIVTMKFQGLDNKSVYHLKKMDTHTLDMYREDSDSNPDPKEVQKEVFEIFLSK